MDCGCILMIVSVAFGIGSIGAGFKALNNPAAAAASPRTFFLIGIAFIVAPFAWLWWATKQDEKRWRK